jgi:hypothetical protein
MPTVPERPGRRRTDPPEATTRPEISLADLVRVAGKLDAGPRTLRTAAVVLGLTAPAPPPGLPDVTPPPLPAPSRVPQPGEGRVRSADDAVVEVRPAGTDNRPARAARLELIEPADPTPPRSVAASVQTLFPEPATRPDHPQAPLFEPAHQRAVLTTLASVDRAGSELDFDALVDRLAAREPVGDLPRLSEPTTRLGVLLLLDTGPSMDPFRRDQRLLADALRLVVGDDAVQVLAVRGRLHTGRPVSGGNRDPVRLPGPGPRPTLLASDLGTARQGGGPQLTRPSDWLGMAARAREAGSPLVVLNPYPPARWPEWAMPALTVVHWDRPADAGHARRAARRAAVLARIRR